MTTANSGRAPRRLQRALPPARNVGTRERWLWLAGGIALGAAGAALIYRGGTLGRLIAAGSGGVSEQWRRDPAALEQGMETGAGELIGHPLASGELGAEPIAPASADTAARPKK